MKNISYILLLLPNKPEIEPHHELKLIIFLLILQLILTFINFIFYLLNRKKLNK
jgi:hypothetical protein